jgi:PAS domain S-box-containing protein
VLLLENYQSAAAFTDESLALVTSLAQQTALNLENTRLYQAAEERASQLQALTGVAATITSNLRPDDLVATLLDLLEAILPFDTGTLWLRQGKKLLVVRAARGFADDEERVGLTVAVEDSALLSQMLATGLPIAIGDVRQDMRFPSLVEPERLSWLSVPLIASGDVIGVIALEKTETNFYTPEHSQIATTFAGQAAVALENARLYQESLTRTQELDQRSQRLEMLNRLSGALSATLEPRRILEAASQELARAINSTGALGVLFAPDGKAVLEYETPEPPDKLPNTLPEAPLFERLRESLGVFNTDDVSGEADLAPLSEFFSRRSAGSVLAITLATGSEAQGLLLAYAQRKERFSADEVGLARTIGNQTSIAIQNARLYAETRSLTQDLEQRVVERTVELERAHHRAETLLRIISELSTSLDLEQVLNRSLQLINQIVDAGQISVLIARPGEKKLHRLASLGYAGNTALGGKTTPFNVDQGLAGWVISSRQAALIEDVLRDPRWILLTDSPQPQHRSCMAVPLMVGAECLGVLLLYHSEVGHFSTEQLDLVQAAANQVAVAINNAELYRLIRDQAEDLGNMFRRQQVEASRSRSILEAVADGVLVTDATRVITLFNASAEDILELERSQVIGKSLDHFIGLFGGAGQRWSETIRTWSQDPTSYQPGDIYAEQINLEDGRVVSVHLSPVSMRESFLGTVSTFRDITHQVQLDRLKSEFVATVSHELRTPMTSIKGYVDILLMGAAGELSDQQGEFLGIVRNNTERLAVLVNDLLDISRIEAGRVTISMLPLNLEEVCREAARAMQARMEVEQKPMQIEVEAPPGLPRATGDMDRVRQILDNLLENAYYYTEAGGNIRLQIHVAGDELQVDVVDNGIGISPDTQPRIFERFYRGEHPFVLATSGTGLGLAIVQHLVQMHNGKIWFESSGIPGEGSTFSFTLPIYRMAET